MSPQVIEFAIEERASERRVAVSVSIEIAHDENRQPGLGAGFLEDGLDDAIAPVAALAARLGALPEVDVEDEERAVSGEPDDAEVNAAELEGDAELAGE